VMAVTLLLVGLLGWKYFRRLGADSLETLRGVLTKETETDPTDTTVDLLDVHTERFEVGGFSAAHGYSLREIDLRARTGASVIGVERAGHTVVNPTADEKLRAGDVVLLLGDDEQIARARALLK